MSHEYTNSYSKQAANGQLVAVQGTIKGFNQSRAKGKKRSLSSEKKLESVGLAAYSAQRSRVDQASYQNEDYTPLKTEKVPSAGIARISHDNQSMSARSSRIDNKRHTVQENRITNTNMKTKGSGCSSREDRSLSRDKDENVILHDSGQHNSSEAFKLSTTQFLE